MVRVLTVNLRIFFSNAAYTIVSLTLILHVEMESTSNFVFDKLLARESYSDVSSILGALEARTSSFPLSITVFGARLGSAIR